MRASCSAALLAPPATALLNVFVGDDGAPPPTPAKGLVPAPATGDAAANKFLFADGTWKAVTATPETHYFGDGVDGAATLDGSKKLIVQSRS